MPEQTELEKLHKYLLELREELDESEAQYQIDTQNTSDPSYMDKELSGTLRYDYICESMKDHTEHVLQKLGMDVTKAAEIVFNITGIMCL